MADVKYISYAVQVKQALEDSIDVALLATGILVQGEAILLAPADTGKLRQSIDYQTEPLRVLIGSYSEYAIYVEKGTGIYAEDGKGRKTPWVYYDNVRQQYVYTVGSEPQPFLGPALLRNREKIKEIFIKELKNLED